MNHLVHERFMNGSVREARGHEAWFMNGPVHERFMNGSVHEHFP